MQSMYVDDVDFGADTEDARALYASSREIFNLRKFVTNSPSLQKWFDAQEATPTSTTSAKTIGDPVEVKGEVLSEETYVETTLPVN